MGGGRVCPRGVGAVAAAGGGCRVTIFILIWLSYTLIAYNTRAVARGEYLSTMVTDALIAVVGFFLVKEIVVGGMGDLARYVAGAMAGGASGIWLSKRAGA